jgi:hypothetical protein
MEKQGMRDFLIRNIAAELEKDPGSLDGDFIDRRIDELYALEGREAPKLSGEALDAAARTVRSRAAWRRRNALESRARKRVRTRRLVRGAWAACFTALFFFSANYVAALITGSCLPAHAGIQVCCGTKYCRCEIARGEEDAPARPE